MADSYPAPIVNSLTDALKAALAALQDPSIKPPVTATVTNDDLGTTTIVIQ